jgi:hypothetical protein
MARSIVPVFIEDTPKYEEMAAMEKMIHTTEIKLPKIEPLKIIDPL